MARYHYWQYLVNREGQPINNANISIYEAGTTTDATVYTSEFGSDTVSVSPHLTTNQLGYFEFWIGDPDETSGYELGKKFKIKWDRSGISSGYIDYINIFPAFEEIDETDNLDSSKNKLLSNVLAYGWENHKDFNVLTDGFPIHGITYVNTTSSDNQFNKLISNNLGKGWEDHKNYTFTTSTTATSGDEAHGLAPVVLGDDDPVFNKLVSNNTLKNMSVSFKETVSTASLTSSGALYYYDIEHNLNENWPIIFIYNTSTRNKEEPEEVYSIDENSLRIWLSTQINFVAKVMK